MSDNLSPALAAEGTLLQLGAGTSPETWQTIANVGDITGPAFDSTVVDITSHSSQAPFRQRIVTLLSIGDVTFKCFWVPQNDTQRNAITGVFGGIRYNYINRLLKEYRLRYTDGSSSDTFNAYVTKLSEVAPVAGVYEMTVTLSGTGAPTAFV